MAVQVRYNTLGWHDGESSMHRLLQVPEYRNPSSFGMSDHADYLLQISSMLAVGTIDAEGRPWTTLLGGEPGFAKSLGANVVGVKATVGRKYDPVIETLLHADSKGRGLSALGIHLDSRDRVKLSGQFLGGGLIDSSPTSGSHSDLKENRKSEIQMAFVVERSLGNCPKYLNKKTLVPVIPDPVLVSDTVTLCDAAVDLLSKADLFFISTSHQNANMGTNHRGGPPGFVRIDSVTTQRTTLVYPEYSGNRLYQTLGNLSITPKAGLVFPDFETGDVLFITGTTEIAYGEEAAHIIPRSNLLVRIHVTGARFVQHGLSFRGQAGERSPYNPPVRYLTSEQQSTTVLDKGSMAHATLMSRTLLTPTIARFNFRISTPPTTAKPNWSAGQYVALGFEDELSLGYSHMREDDPKSLNDDYVRTFTVSSPPPASTLAVDGEENTASSSGRDKQLEFEITIRNVGAVTSFLFRYPIRSGLEVPLMGFGGTFCIDTAPKSNNSGSERSQKGTEIPIPFIAGGIGITPLFAQLPELQALGLLQRPRLGKGGLRLFWAVHVRDLGLVVNTLERFPGLGAHMRIFISGTGSTSEKSKDGRAGKKLVENVKGMIDGGEREVVERRITQEDLLAETEGLEDARAWYLCTGKPLRKEILGWLKARKTVFEDFDY